MTNRHDVDELLGELRAALDVEPSRDFEAGVRQRVANETTPATRWWWIGAAAAVASAAVVVATMMPRSRAVDGRRPMPVARVVSPAEPAAAVTAADAPVPVKTIQSTRPKKSGAARKAPASQPQQDEMLQQLVAAMWSGQVRTAPRIGGDTGQVEVGALDVPEPIQLSTIRIDPLYEEF